MAMVFAMCILISVSGLTLHQANQHTYISKCIYLLQRIMLLIVYSILLLLFFLCVFFVFFKCDVYAAALARSVIFVAHTIFLPLGRR